MKTSTHQRGWLAVCVTLLLCGCASSGRATKVDERVHDGQSVATSDYQAEEKNYAGDLAHLEREEVNQTMQALQPQIHRCGNKYNVGGSTTFVVSVKEGGQVRAVRAEGGFAGTPQADCIAQVLMSAKFPPCAPTTFPVPVTIKARN